MKVLVLGSTGKTGFQVVKQLLKNPVQVKAVARNPLIFKELDDNKNLEVVTASILDIENKELEGILADIDIIISCLGHNISFKGIFGKPHYLVTEAIKKVCFNKEITIPAKKLIVMNTTACLNPDTNEKLSFGEKVVMGMMRTFLPPQRDNNKAVKLLKQSRVDADNEIEWIAVRPDTLIDEDKVSEWKVFETIQRSPVFNAGETSRIHVADFMQKLVSDEKLWEEWKFKMPVIYNAK